MPSIRATAKSFNGRHVSINGTSSQSFTWSELIWAAITVGKAEANHLIRFGMYSWFELIYRAAIVYANLREDGMGRLTKSDAFTALDPSEKGAMSYFFGLTTAKLLAEARLGVSWLMHLDVYRDQLEPISVHRSKVKPDLIGMNSHNEWVVIEAKGRSGAMPTNVMKKAKDQTTNLYSVKGVPVSLRIAHGAYFEAGLLATHWIDPRGRDRASRLEIDVEQFELAYYAPIRALINAPSRRTRIRLIDGQQFRIATFPELDLNIGLRQTSAVAGLGYADMMDVPGIETSISPSSQFVGGDGVAIQLGPSWSEDRMRREPFERPIIPGRDRLA